MKIIITGSSGFIGQNLAQYLKMKGVEVILLSLRNDTWRLSGSADAVIHLAGKAHDTRNTSSPKDYFEINTELTKRLFNQFLTSDIQDFFFFSSVKAVADTVEGVLEENQEPYPDTPYGKSKLLAEEHLLSKELPVGKRLFIIRPCMVHGEGNKGNLNLLYKIVEKGMPWFLASFENQRSFLSIDNLNFVLFELLKNKKIPSGIYNVSDDESLSTNKLISIISNTLGKKPKLWHWSANVITKVAKIGDKLSLPLNSERLKKLTESYVVSNRKIKSALGIEKLPYTAEEGLIKTIKSFHNKK
ncbi:NAD-dependent epimerase/dehydratase family protein [Riemerella anatipestifer]|nr:NAD-dependent epimerase/dehydratase family protein [Riemerella anatipestifer]MDY3325296.1 NAD-dependent epimerase/dehydratase family protein [Riemerella anatipestifer]MDY3352714.1 NAD-dependent epimerase/dehydratase family protein [Riemerella anatipestifer]